MRIAFALLLALVVACDPGAEVISHDSKLGANESSVIIGALDWSSTTTLTGIPAQRAKAVGHLNIPAKLSRCTTWLVANDLAVTNAHCISTPGQAQGATATFNYEDGVVSSSRIAYPCGELAFVNTEFDVAVLRCGRVGGRLPGEVYGTLKVGPVPLPGEGVYVIHQNCVQPPGGACEPTKKYSPGVLVNANHSYVDASHSADTLGGSSGSPVLSVSGNEVVALHRAGDLSGSNPVNLGVKPSHLRGVFGENGIPGFMAFWLGLEWINGPFSYGGSHQFQVADVTGDGKADVVAVHPEDERLLVWASTGTGFATGAQWLNGPHWYPQFQFFVADVTGDGKADVVGIHREEERMLVWKSLGTGFAVGEEWINGPFWYANSQFQVADVTGDGKADVVAIHPEEERMVVWVSTGTSFATGTEWINGPFWYGNSQFHVADLTGDGKADVVAIHREEERMVVWKSTGTAFAVGSEWLNGPFWYGDTHQFQVADVTGDGKADVVAIHPEDERLIVWRSTGTAFDAGLEWHNGQFWYAGVHFRVADVTGDGKADVVGIHREEERMLVWRSVGSD